MRYIRIASFFLALREGGMRNTEPAKRLGVSETVIRRILDPKHSTKPERIQTALVAVEAIRGEKTLSQLGSQFQVHPIQIAKWRKSALEQLPELFVDGRTRKGRNGEAESDALHEISTLNE